MNLHTTFNIALVTVLLSLSCGNRTVQSQTIETHYSIDKKTADIALTDSLLAFHCAPKAVSDSIYRNLLGRYTPEKELRLNIVHRRYGKLQPELTLSLKDVICMFMDEFDLFGSIGETDGKDVSLTLILKHKNINFIHMLLVNAKTEDFLSGKEAVKADLYSYIPQKF